ncbi:MAG: hypothetical protein CMH83_01965 [Nocardioides sp.]|nr:hypothetical protein [Nocardioides sp.]
MIQVRRSVADDLPAIRALAALPGEGLTADPGVPLPLPPRAVAPDGADDLRDPTSYDGGVLLVALVDGHVAGVAGMRPVAGRPRTGRVVRLGVHPATRREGVATALTEALEDEARRRGLTELLLRVGDHQPEALALYRSLGWSESWRESRPEWSWTLVWFHRALVPGVLSVQVRACADEAEADAAEDTLPTDDRAHRGRLARQRAGEGTYLLAWAGDVVVGHVFVSGVSEHADVRDALGEHPEAQHLEVAEAVRRRGVGVAVLDAATALAREQGAGLVGLAVEPDNAAGATLSRRRGWLRRPGLTPEREWTWTGPDGQERVERDRYDYWTRALAVPART